MAMTIDETSMAMTPSLQLPATALDTGTFQVDFPSLIKVLGENLYSNPRACVRELIQNANDSCIRRYAAGNTFTPIIHITAKQEERLLMFDDNGAGMLHEDVVHYLASIGGGRTREERTRLSTDNEQAAGLLIGQFGIGFLSSFVVADRVIVETLSIEGGESVLWECEGTAEYHIGKGSRTTPGTRVTLVLKPAHYDLLDEKILTSTIVYYADFIGIPIYLNNHPNHINRMKAPWHDASNLEEYRIYIEHRYGIKPLALEPIVVQQEDLELHGVLFIPTRSADWKRHLRSIDVFQKRMFIGEDLHILPEWAGFISGILDCSTLDLVASRESAISERPSYKALQTYLGQAVASFIQRLATHERAIFLEVIKQHEWAVKWGAVRDDFFFDQVKDLIPISSDMGPLTIPKYLERTPQRLGGIQTIYYVPGQHMLAQQQSSVFRAQGIPIYSAESVDEQFLKKYAEISPNINLRQMVSGVIEMMEFVEGDHWRKLESRYQAMGIIARGVRFHPPEMPALAVRRTEYDQDKMIDQVIGGNRTLVDFLGRVGKETADAYELCFNTDNPIIQRLATYDGDSAVLEAVLRSIYSSALLAAGIDLSHELSQTIAQSEMQIIALVLNQDEQLRKQGVTTRTPLPSLTASPAIEPTKALEYGLGRTTPPQIPSSTSAASPPAPSGASAPYALQDGSQTAYSANQSSPQSEFRYHKPNFSTYQSEQASGTPSPSSYKGTPWENYREPDAGTNQAAPSQPASQTESRPFSDPESKQWRRANAYMPASQDDRPFRDPEHRGLKPPSRNPQEPFAPMHQSSAVPGEPMSEHPPLFQRLVKKLLR